MKAFIAESRGEIEKYSLEAAMNYHNLIVETSGCLMVVTLNRPERLNAINLELMMELKQLMGELRADQETRFVIFTGAGTAFSCGVEFTDEEMKKRYSRPELANERLWQIFGQEFMHAMENLEQVTVAAVNGAAVGAGLCLAMNCDFRIASDAALFGIPEANLGIFFTWGATPRLTALIGPVKAKQLIMTCENISAQEAVAIGLVNKFVPQSELMGACRDLVKSMEARGPLALRICKKIINASSTARMADLYLCEPELVERLMLSEDVKEGIRAFLEKRPPRFPRK
jgi:enoyl-CoA hydratase/carnithine racemase